MRIACVSTYDATSTVGFSARGYYQAQSLAEQGVDIKYIDLSRSYRYFPPICKAKYVYYRLLGQRYTRDRDSVLLRYYAHEIRRQLSTMNVEAVFSPISPASQPIAYLDCDQPIVIWTDATFRGHMDAFSYNPYYSKMCKESVMDGIANEKSALSRCSLAIYSSDWAAQTAIKNYQIASSKVKVVPFGPYIERNVTFDDINRAVNSRPSHECKLLFVGTDWYWKGGDTALNVAQELNRKGLRTRLTVVGCHPIINVPLPSFVQSLGYIDISTREGLDMISRLYSESHFLILPSLCEAFGAVFCEASSFGVPSLATNVGGIPTAIKGDLNGKTFPRDADIEEYCNYILDLFSDYPKYKALALSSFHQYQSRLNWFVAGRTVKTLMMDLIGSKR